MYIHLGWSDILVALVALCYLLPDSRSKADHSKVLYFNEVCISNNEHMTREYCLFKHCLFIDLS